MKKLFALSLLAAAVVLSPLSAADKDGNLTIGFMGRTATDPAYAVALAGARQAAQDLGITYTIKVKIEVRTSPSSDPRLQAAAIEKLVAEGADGVALACADSDLVTAAIDKAANAGVPVATFDSDAPNSKRFFAYLSDQEQCGHTLMIQLAKAMEGKGAYAILAGNLDSAPQQERIRGIKVGATLSPGIKFKGVYYTKETTADSVVCLAEVMKANPDITGWVLTGSWPLSDPKPFPWAAGAVKCVAVGILPNQLAPLRNESVQMVIAQPYYEWGYRTMEKLILKATMNRRPAEPIEYAAINVVTPRNVGDFEKAIESWSTKDLASTK